MPATPESAPLPHAHGRPPGIGAGANFFDTLGIGSFATTTAVLAPRHDSSRTKTFPGTLNVGHAIPTITEAVIFIILLGGLIDLPTIVTMVLAGGIGAWFGTGIVVHWPRRTIQRAMAIALVITAAFMAMRMLLNLSLAEGTIGLTGLALVIAIVASLVIGSLTSLGIGNYAPTMAVTYLLGMNQKSVFPIMAASASLILPAAALRFYRAGRFDRRDRARPRRSAAFRACWSPRSSSRSCRSAPCKWIVVGVLLYTSATLWMSSRNAASVA